MRRVFISILTIFLLMPAGIAKAETLVIAGGDNPNHLVKVAQLVVTDIYQKLGYHVEFGHRPLKRSLAEANAGMFDAEVARVKGLEEKFPDLIRVPVAIYKIEGVAFTKNKDFPVEGWESLRPYKIGVLRGVQFAEKGTQGFNRECVGSLDSLFVMLANGKFDVVVEAKLNGVIMVEQLKLHDSIRILTPPLMTMDLFHYVHKKNKCLVPKLTKLLSRMKQDGSLDELIRRSEQKVIAAAMEKTNREKQPPCPVEKN